MAVLTFVTGNAHKFAEARDKIQVALPALELVQQAADLVEIQAITLEPVAKFKLEQARELVQGSVFIEDAGFFVEAFPGFPGVYSADIFRMIGNEGVLRLLAGETNRAARFEAVVAYHDAPTGKDHLFKGVVRGTVADRVRGDQGFGYDPIFLPADHPSKTFGELTAREKNALSHRARALREFMDFLEAASAVK